MKLLVEKFSIIYFNRHNSKKTKQLLEKIAQDVPDVNFLEIDVPLPILRATTISTSML